MPNIKYAYFLVSFIFLIFISGTQLCAQNMNQVGYLPGSEKRVFLDKEYQAKDFSITNAKGKQVLFGNVTVAKYWDNSGEEVCYADFSSLSKQGYYSLKVDGLPESVQFEIDADIYNNIGKDVVRMFYHARASMPIEKQYAGMYARPAGHLDNRVKVHASAATKQRPEGTMISSPGGWYDAGDYNKYIVNSSISVYTLLQAEHLYGKHLQSLDLNIPETGNGLSDVLNETLYNLRWMLTMQDPNDGGVYHKLTSKKFCGMIMPHKDKLDRYVVMKSTAATLDFAATMSKAYRVLKPYSKVLPGIADSCLQAAKLAWKWSIKNPEVLYVQPADIKTGEYKDKNISDEWIWAASELYLSTNESKYFNKIDLDYKRFHIPQWGNVATLSLYSIATSKTNNEKLKERATSKLINLANNYYKKYEKSPYKVSIDRFPWGSNGEVSNHGMLFLQAYQVSKDDKYKKAADACLGYILGANPTGYCFVTGYGAKSPKHIHERITESNGIENPLPGFVVGGPTKQAQKDCGAENYPSEFPAKSYLDKECSYSTNEIAINWNSPLAFLSLGLDAVVSKK
ncbi:cellulase [Labilibacter sediminis]|nr:cellulase [Labilibacter sediminis]